MWPRLSSRATGFLEHVVDRDGACREQRRAERIAAPQRVNLTVPVASRLQHRDVRLRLGAWTETYRVLHAEQYRVPQLPVQESDQSLHSRGMPWSDRAHLDDLPVEQFDAVVLVQNAHLGQAVVVVHRERALEQSFRHT